jgi:intracellular multiplication protein IcmT
MANWRDTFKPARFFPLDARAGLFVVAMLLHIRPWTITLTIVAIAAFWYLERLGMDFTSALRGMRSWLAGRIRPAQPEYKHRDPVDWDS